MVGNDQDFFVGEAALAVVAELFQQPVDARVDVPPVFAVERIIAELAVGRIGIDQHVRMIHAGLDQQLIKIILVAL